MKLDWVTLDRDRRKPHVPNDMTRAFRSADGYALEIREGLLLISHSGKTTCGSLTYIIDGVPILGEGEPVTKADSPQAKAGAK